MGFPGWKLICPRILPPPKCIEARVVNLSRPLVRSGPHTAANEPWVRPTREHHRGDPPPLPPQPVWPRAHRCESRVRCAGSRVTQPISAGLSVPSIHNFQNIDAWGCGLRPGCITDSHKTALRLAAGEQSRQPPGRTWTSSCLHPELARARIMDTRPSKSARNAKALSCGIKVGTFGPLSRPRLTHRGLRLGCAKVRSSGRQ